MGADFEFEQKQAKVATWNVVNKGSEGRPKKGLFEQEQIPQSRDRQRSISSGVNAPSRLSSLTVETV